VPACYSLPEGVQWVGFNVKLEVVEPGNWSLKSNLKRAARDATWLIYENLRSNHNFPLCYLRCGHMAVCRTYLLDTTPGQVGHDLHLGRLNKRNYKSVHSQLVSKS